MTLRSDLERQLRDIAEEVEEIEQTVNVLKKDRVDLSGVVQSLSDLTALVQQIANELLPPTSTLTAISQNFTLNGATMQGPITLNVGQTTKETVLGFNADGTPFTGPMPAVTYAIDNTAAASGADDGANGSDITGLSGGSANASASLTTAEGLALSVSTVITVNAVVPTQVLTSIVQDFTTPAP